MAVTLGVCPPPPLAVAGRKGPTKSLDLAFAPVRPLQQMTAAGRAITAAEPGDWHWQM